MIDPSVLNLRSTTPDGKAVRWGGSEPDAERIPQGLTFGTQMPGGFDTMGCSFGREIRDWGDLGLFDAVEVYGQGGLTAWEGRQAEHPADSSSRSIQVNAVGHSAHLLDDPSFVEIYIDRDPNSWAELTRDQHLVLTATGHPLDKDYTASVKRGGLAFTGGTQKAIDTGSMAGLMYVAPAGVKVHQFQYRASEAGASIANCQVARLLAGDDDAIAGLADSYDLNPDDVVHRVALSPDRKYLMLRLQASVDHTPATGNASRRHYKAVGVIGQHGLPLHTNDDPTQPDGVLGSDVIADIVARGAPLLNFSTGAEGSIETTDFVIPHLVFKDQVSPSDAIQFVNAFHLFDWGVGEGHMFFFRNPLHYRRRWVVRQDEGATVAFEGPQTENAVNGIVVAFTDEQGNAKTAGPPGSTCDYTNSDLIDLDPLNPVNAAGIPQKWGRIEIAATTTSYGAIQVGARWLAEAMETPDRGSVVCDAWVREVDTGIPFPAWCVRAGDSIRVADGDNRERRIVSTTYAHDELSLTATLDNLPHQLDAIMERMGVELIGHLSTT